MKQPIFVAFLFLLWIPVSNAQQDPLTSQFWNNYSQFNPATTGLFYDHQATLAYRNQWNHVNGAPVSLFANYGILLGRHHGLGIAGDINIAGFYKTSELNINYNYQFIVGEQMGIPQKISVGIGAGLSQLGSNADWIPPTTTNDPYIPVTGATLAPNFNAGIAYHGQALFVGTGVTHIVPSSFRLATNSYYNQARHYYLMASYTFRTGEGKRVELIPQIQGRTDAVKLSFDLNLLAAYNIKDKQRVWAGISYRYQDAVGVQVGCDFFKRYRVGYSYDISINPLSLLSSGSHEFVLAFHMNNKPRKPVSED